MKSNVHLLQRLPEMFLEWEMFQTDVEKIKTYISCSKKLFWKIIFYEVIHNNVRAREDTI